MASRGIFHKIYFGKDLIRDTNDSLVTSQVGESEVLLVDSWANQLERGSDILT